MALSFFGCVVPRDNATDKTLNAAADTTCNGPAEIKGAGDSDDQGLSLFGQSLLIHSLLFYGWPRGHFCCGFKTQMGGGRRVRVSVHINLVMNEQRTNIFPLSIYSLSVSIQPLCHHW